MKNWILLAMLLAFGMNAYSQRKTEIVETVNVPAADDGLVLKRKVAIGRFSNETQYAKGIFYDKENDPMGKQALDILSSKLAASGKFLLLERSDLAALLEECQKNGGGAATIGADYMIIGSITEFGRKDTGKSKMFGAEKTQMVEAAKEKDTGMENELQHRIALVMARNSAIVAGQALSNQEMDSLLGELFQCQNPNLTPTGKVIVSILEHTQIEKMFGR